MTYHSVKGLAKEFSVCPRVVYNLISEGKIKAYKIGRQYRIPPKEVENFKQNQLKGM